MRTETPCGTHYLARALAAPPTSRLGSAAKALPPYSSTHPLLLPALSSKSLHFHTISFPAPPLSIYLKKCSFCEPPLTEVNVTN